MGKIPASDNRDDNERKWQEQKAVAAEERASVNEPRSIRVAGFLKLRGQEQGIKLQRHAYGDDEEQNGAVTEAGNNGDEPNTLRHDWPDADS